MLTYTFGESQYQRGQRQRVCSIIVWSGGEILHPSWTCPASLWCAGKAKHKTGKQTGSLFRQFLGYNDLIRHFSELNSALAIENDMLKTTNLETHCYTAHTIRIPS